MAGPSPVALLCEALCSRKSGTSSHPIITMTMIRARDALRRDGRRRAWRAGLGSVSGGRVCVVGCISISFANVLGGPRDLDAPYGRSTLGHIGRSPQT
jgi:hypothetical protein